MVLLGLKNGLRTFLPTLPLGTNAKYSLGLLWSFVLFLSSQGLTIGVSMSFLFDQRRVNL